MFRHFFSSQRLQPLITVSFIMRFFLPLLAASLLVACDPYTPEQHAQIDPLRARFDETCEQYVFIRPLYDERRYNDCDDWEYTEEEYRTEEGALRISAERGACQASYAEYAARADELESELYAIVRERDTLGFVSWWDDYWMCHTEAYWRRD